MSKRISKKLKLIKWRSTPAPKNLGSDSMCELAAVSAPVGTCVSHYCKDVKTNKQKKNVPRPSCVHFERIKPELLHQFVSGYPDVALHLCFTFTTLTEEVALPLSGWGLQSRHMGAECS